MSACGIRRSPVGRSKPSPENSLGIRALARGRYIVAHGGSRGRGGEWKLSPPPEGGISVLGRQSKAMPLRGLTPLRYMSPSCGGSESNRLRTQGSRHWATIYRPPGVGSRLCDRADAVIRLARTFGIGSPFQGLSGCGHGPQGVTLGFQSTRLWCPQNHSFSHRSGQAQRSSNVSPMSLLLPDDGICGGDQPSVACAGWLSFVLRLTNAVTSSGNCVGAIRASTSRTSMELDILTRSWSRSCTRCTLSKRTGRQPAWCSTAMPPALAAVHSHDTTGRSISGRYHASRAGGNVSQDNRSNQRGETKQK